MTDFNLTPRRREILYHVAFTLELKWRLERDWTRPWSKEGRTYVPKFRLAGTDIHGILMILKRAKLIRYMPLQPEPVLHITPKGMDLLLSQVAL